MSRSHALIYDATSWQAWKVPQDIFRVLCQYVSPHLCVYCQRFMSSTSKICTECYTKKCNDYEREMRFYDSILEFRKKYEPKFQKYDRVFDKAGLDAAIYDEFRAIFDKVNAEYYLGAQILCTKAELYKKNCDLLKKIIDEHEKIWEYLKMDMNSYFSLIQYQEYFIIMEEQQKLFDQLNNLKDKVKLPDDYANFPHLVYKCGDATRHTCNHGPQAREKFGCGNKVAFHVSNNSALEMKKTEVLMELTRFLGTFATVEPPSKTPVRSAPREKINFAGMK